MGPYPAPLGGAEQRAGSAPPHWATWLFARWARLSGRRRECNGTFYPTATYFAEARRQRGVKNPASGKKRVRSCLWPQHAPRRFSLQDST